ncbi:MAG: SEL1-like repeat protein [Oscillospiraceae bacterium]|nr:SEL1-like repeat protein [Oscillospiraceae bacterium]
MLPEREYFVFSKKVSKLLKTCFLGVKHPDDANFIISDKFSLPTSEVFLFSGQSSLTQKNMYYFNKSEALKHKEDLLEICRMLPKLKTIIPGTAGSISYTELLPDEKTNTISLTRYCEHADKFIGLLTINGIGYAEEISGTGSFKAAPIDLAFEYREQVNPGTEAAELTGMPKELEPMKLREYAQKAKDTKDYLSLFALSQEIIDHSHSKNYQKAFAYIQLAELYEYGRYVKQNFKKAAEYFGRAIECGEDIDDIKIKYCLYQMDNYEEMFKEKKESYLKYSPNAPEEALYGLVRKAIKAELDREEISKLMK